MATILIVDDRAPNRDYFKTLLGYNQHRVLEANDGAAGLAQVRAEHPDLVISDILMPTMDGFEFVRQLRADPAIAGTRVIFASAHYLQHETRELANACGIATILTKPCEPEALLRTVDEALGLAHTPAPTPPPLVAFDCAHLQVLTNKLSEKTDKLRQTTARLAALVELGQQATLEYDPARLVEKYCHAAREIIGARCAAIGILAKDGVQVQQFCTSGLPPELAARLGAIRQVEGLEAEVIKQQTTRRVCNPTGDPTALGFPPDYPAIYSYLGAPISSPTRVYGWLCLSNKLGEAEFSAQEEELLAMLAAQLAVVYENAWLYNETQRYVEELGRLNAQVESQRQRLNSIVASVPGVVWESSGQMSAATHRADFVSDYVEKMLGYSVAEWLAQPDFWFSIMHPDDRERVVQEAAAQYDRGGEKRFEIRWITKDGRVIWTEANTVIITDEQGRPNGLRGVMIDVSERKRAEAELSKQQEIFQKIFDHLPVMVSFFDEQGQLKLVNREWERQRGWTLAEVQAQHVDVLAESYPDPQEYRRARDYIANANGEWINVKSRMKDGHVKDLAWAAVRLSDGTTVAIGQDITERKRAEELQLRSLAQAALRADIVAALTKGDDSLRTILKHCTEALVQRLDAAFARVWTFNERENVLELQASAGMYTHLDGGHARVPLGPSKVGLIARERQPLITNDVLSDPGVTDKDWARREGMVAFAGYPLLLEHKLVGVIALFSRHELAEDTLDVLATVADIVSQGIERKRAEEALRQREEQLRQAQKMEAIGTLAGGIAHDFNNMLGVIMGNCELAQWRLPADHAAQVYLAQMLKAGERAKDLVQQILTFSRQKEHDRKPILLQPVLNETLKMLRATLPATIEIRQQIDPQAHAILGDPTQMYQVLMNLGTNAWHAMGERGGILEVTLSCPQITADYARTCADLHEGKYLQLTVSDSGHGMDRAILERIFDPFFTTKAPGQGTGLGLAVVHGIVKKHEGAIKVYSEPGRGTTFKLYFPVYESDAAVTTQQAADLIRGGGARILFVDDEEFLTVLSKEMLELMGYRVTTQNSSVAALELFRAHPDDFDLVITDQTMPVISGAELAEALLAIRPTLPILLTTGYSTTINPEQAQARGIREVLLKPNTAHALGAAIERALAQKRKE